VENAVERRLKAAILEVQEYTYLTGAAIRGIFTRPFYFRDVVEQFEAIGIGSLTVVLLTGFFTGAALALQSGSMIVTDQINALRALGTDPVRKLVVPRLLAGFLMAPVLTVISDAAGLIGGWAIAVLQLRVASSVYWTSVTDALYVQDAWMGLIKPFALGFVIVTIGCHVGLRTRGGTQGVGRATTNAVVAASVAVIAVDFFITPLLISLLY
jgi:phospholipid/cholesterol/gamma-HCH transport system permease protein